MCADQWQVTFHWIARIFLFVEKFTHAKLNAFIKLLMNVDPFRVQDPLISMSHGTQFE